MADENPATNPPQDDDSTKKETIRITLPPKGDAPAVKRETVRINVPGTQSQPLSSIPKKETSKITLPGGATPPPAAVGPPTKPLSSAPPPPAPASPATKPLSNATPPPKPPPLSGRPTVPLRPNAPSGAVPPAAPSGMARPASPKKETARINLPSDAPKSSAPALPKATVKMQQTQPLSKGPVSGTRSQPLASTSQISVAAAASSSPRKSDTWAIVLSVIAFLTSGTALYFTITVWKTADWAESRPEESTWVKKMQKEQPPVPAVFPRKLD